MAGSKVILVALLVMYDHQMVFASSSAEFPRLQWVKCNQSETEHAPSCQDCNNRLLCGPLGGVVIRCWWPGLQYCVNGRCSSEPSDQCVESPAEL